MNINIEDLIFTNKDYSRMYITNKSEKEVYNFIVNFFKINNIIFENELFSVKLRKLMQSCVDISPYEIYKDDSAISLFYNNNEISIGKLVNDFHIETGNVKDGFVEGYYIDKYNLFYSSDEKWAKKLNEIKEKDKQTMKNNVIVIWQWMDK